LDITVAILFLIVVIALILLALDAKTGEKTARLWGRYIAAGDESPAPPPSARASGSPAPARFDGAPIGRRRSDEP